MYEKFISKTAAGGSGYFAQYEIFINASAINFFKSLHNKEENNNRKILIRYY
jgi:hypothetical protein